MNYFFALIVWSLKTTFMTLLVVVFGFLLLPVFSFSGRTSSPMTIPQAKQSLPGISWDQLWQDRENQYQLLDQKIYHPKYEKEVKTNIQKSNAYLKRVSDPFLRDTLYFIRTHITGPKEYSCSFYHGWSMFWPIVNAPLDGYAAIHREFIENIPSSSRGFVAPKGMFPEADKATLNDYLDASWYGFQEWYWSNFVGGGDYMCKIPHPSQTMKEQIKGAKKK